MVAKSLAVVSVTLALIGFLILSAGTAVGVPSLTDETETPISTSTPDSTTPTPATPPPERVLLSGIVTLNGDVAPPGVGLKVLNEDALCGEAVTQQGGRYEAFLTENCPVDTEVTFQLRDIPDIRFEGVTLSEALEQDVNVAFEDLNINDLLAVGVLTEPEAVEDAVADVVAAARTTGSQPGSKQSPDLYRDGDLCYRRLSSSCRPGQIEVPGARQRY